MRAAHVIYLSDRLGDWMGPVTWDPASTITVRVSCTPLVESEQLVNVLLPDQEVTIDNEGVTPRVHEIGGKRHLALRFEMRRPLVAADLVQTSAPPGT